MHIEFLADNAVTRKHARLIYRQFFPFYLRWMWLQWAFFLLLIFALIELISFVRTDDIEIWMDAWGMPERFVQWQYAPIVFVFGLLSAVFVVEFVVRHFRRKSETQFAIVAPPEQATLDLTEADITMKSASALLTVPFDKITGLGLDKAALAIGFSGSGMIIPRSAFATSAEETAFLRAVAKGLCAEALQRSSEAVKKLL